ncbi:Pre-mRNA-splicing factor cwf19 [Coemansia sp. Benny D115]|nr:Pre-mRNA-splicing factor cwf19 [Coemansia sp. Benny D115]
MSEQVRGYFYEALVNSDEEWSQHRKVIETGPPKYPAGFRARMNPQVPYFHVWLNPKGGLGHVIEDRMRFEPWLGRSVVAGMLDLPPTLYRKPRLLRETREQRISRADEWKSQFDWPKYDWTKML